MGAEVVGLVGRGSRPGPTGGGGGPAIDRPAPAVEPGSEQSRAASPRRSITVVGARGGAGTTTVAAAMAVFAADHLPTELVSGDAAPLLATAAPDGETNSFPVTAGLSLVAPVGRAGNPIGNLTGGSNLVVIDGGNLAHTGPFGNGHGHGIELVVLRGPCYLGMHTLMSCQERAAGIILVAEKGRSLSERDVEEVLGVPVVVRVQHSEAVARCIDAGLLVARLDQLLEFRELSRYVAGLVGTVPPPGRAA